MHRNLYILAGTLFFFAAVCFTLSYTQVGHQPGSPGDVALWRTMGIAFLVFSLFVTLAGILSTLFAQAERRADEARRIRRRR